MYKVYGSMMVFLIFYIDDMLFIGNDVGLLSTIKVQLFA